MCSATCAKYTLFVFNFIFLLSGAGILGIGIWLRVDPTILQYLEVVNIAHSDPYIEHAAFLLIAVGAFVFFIAFLGCCGAIRESQCLLFVYAALLFVVMAGELAAAILALIYKNKITSNLQKSMREQVKNEISPGTASSKAWDFLQVKLECCGADNFTDYKDSHWSNVTKQNSSDDVVPKSCCVLSNSDPNDPLPKSPSRCQDEARKGQAGEYLKSKGCYSGLINWFETHSVILIGVGFGVGAIQIFGFILACCLRSALKNEAGKQYS